VAAVLTMAGDATGDVRATMPAPTVRDASTAPLTFRRRAVARFFALMSLHFDASRAQVKQGPEIGEPGASGERKPGG
jgi:hypothetical protein